MTLNPPLYVTQAGTDWAVWAQRATLNAEQFVGMTAAAREPLCTLEPGATP